MKNTIIIIVISLITFSLLTGCGSAEAIEQYNYSTTKFKLEEAIMQVLRNNTNPNIIWDSAVAVRKNRSFTEMDTINASIYKGEFVWITIMNEGIQYMYTFRYLGDEQYWKTSDHSEIFISHVQNNLGLNLIQGENVGDFSSQEAEKAKKLFEKEFISRLNKELNIKQTTGRSFFQ